jgi:hypothetical protein
MTPGEAAKPKTVGRCSLKTEMNFLIEKVRANWQLTLAGSKDFAEGSDVESLEFSIL